MDIVVADIPLKYGMVLSRSWGEKIQGSLQLDMSYATILVFGHPKKLYRETLMKYVVSTHERPQKFPIYSMNYDIDSFILYNAKSNQENTSDNIISELKEITVAEYNQSIQIQEISDNKDDRDTLVKEYFVAPDSKNYQHEIL